MATAERTLTNGVTGGRRKVHKEGLHCLHTSPDGTRKNNQTVDKLGGARRTRGRDEK